MMQTLKEKVYTLLESSDSGVLRIDDYVLTTMIVLNVVSVMLETLPELRVYRRWFDVFDTFSIVVFSLEYVLRVWSITCAPRYSHAVNGRLQYMATPLALIDLLAIMPFYLPMIVPDLRFLRLLRLVRILKLVRYSSALRTIGAIFWAKREELVITLFAALFLLIVASSIVYYAEHEAQPEAFSSIPAAMWWGIATVTTVGYGDVYPITSFGRFCTGIIALLGIGLFALPAGILAGGFSEEIQKKRQEERQMELACCPHCGKALMGKDDDGQVSAVVKRGEEV